MAQDQADDLKAFERRMMEIVSSLQPSMWRWRLILLTLLLIMFTTFGVLISNLLFSSSSIPSTSISNDKSYLLIILSNIFRKEISFSISFVLLIFAFLFGIHRKIFASSIIISRFRYILSDYNMSCDSNGRLIIKPRPTPMF